MEQHFHREIKRLNSKLATLGGMVEENLNRSLKCLREETTPSFISEIRAIEKKVDALEVDIEEDCLKILALYQPVARDLRFLVTVIKVLNELENMGDLAEKIARDAKRLSIQQIADSQMDLSLMGQKAKEMLSKALDALLTENAELAKRVLSLDDDVDAMHYNHHAIVAAEISSSGGKGCEPKLALLSVSRSLERLADMSTSIAEDVIYYVEGTIIRHHAPSV